MVDIGKNLLPTVGKNETHGTYWDTPPIPTGAKHLFGGGSFKVNYERNRLPLLSYGTTDSGPASS